MMKEEKKQQSQQEEKEQDNKKYTLKVVITTVIATLLLIAILLLCVLFGLKNCSGYSKDNTSSELPIDIERNNKITDIFKKIVKKNLVANGYDDDYLTEINAITYTDNYPNNFSLNISVSSLSKVYFCSITDYPYEGDTSTYDNFLSYLLSDTTEYKASKSSASVNPLKLTDKAINTSKDKYKYVISESNSEPVDRYIDGLYLEDGNYYIYQHKLVVDNIDPFTSASNQIIKSDSPLYNYYQSKLL